MEMLIYTEEGRIYNGSPKNFRIVMRDEKTEREYLLIPASCKPKISIEKSRETKIRTSTDRI